MDDLQRKQIQALRMNGYGYKRIAGVTGLSVYSVRSFCRNHGMGGTAQFLPMNLETIREQEGRCRNCGAKLRVKQTGRKKHFCSGRCRMQHWRKEHEGGHDGGYHCAEEE